MMSILKKLFKILIVIALAYAVGRFIVVFTDSRLTGERAPYIQSLSTNSVIIRWMTEDNQLGIVRYGEDSEHISDIVLETSPSKNHSVILNDLKPGSRYFYQVGEIGSFQPLVTDKQWFYTQPVEEVATRVWVMGDSGKAGEVQIQVRDAALNWMRKNPLPNRQVATEDKNSVFDLWFILGDIAYRSGTNEQFQQSLFDVYEDILSNTSFWPVYGNHDDRRWTYFRVFDMPENAELGGVASHTENYYSFDHSNIHFVVLDSQDSNRSADGEMANWLKEDLAYNSKPWVIAAFHHPPYSKGSHNSDDSRDSRGRMQDMRENFVPILEQAGVDIVLSGHSHMYERSYLIDCAYQLSDKFSSKNIVSNGINEKHASYIKPLPVTGNNGAIYLVSGSASKVDNGPMDHPAHHKGYLEAGSVVIDVEGNTLTAHFINNNGVVRDQFSISKQTDYTGDYQGCLN